MKTPPKTESDAPAKKPRKAAAPTAAKSTAKPAVPKRARATAKTKVESGPGEPSAPKKAARKPKAKARPAGPDAAKVVVAALDDLKGLDIKVLDVRELTVITDTMVICTGTSNRHVKSLAQNVLDQAKSQGIRPVGVEGLAEGEWVLVDLNGVLVHVMQAQTRAFYQLEKLWDMAGPGGLAAAARR